FCFLSATLQYWSNFFKLFFTYIAWIAFLHRYTSFLTMLILPHIFEILNRFLEKCRRLWKNCERKLNTSLQMIVLSFISLLLRRF
ncbi:hypothetical protein OZD63_03535, partial [Wolbachia endosymbiont of Drosophila leontia]|nr:hypothetical protein [Wolbachia endosymbiont of Drosophila leontia]